MGKPIVSTAILKLIEDGKIGLDDELSQYFPEFENMVVAPLGDLDVPFETAKTKITIRNLLTHTSGFTYRPDVLGVGDVAEQYAELGVMTQNYSLEENLELLAQIPLVAHPGTFSTIRLALMFSGLSLRKSRACGSGNTWINSFSSQWA